MEPTRRHSQAPQDRPQREGVAGEREPEQRRELPDPSPQLQDLLSELRLCEVGTIQTDHGRRRRAQPPTRAGVAALRHHVGREWPPRARGQVRRRRGRWAGRSRSTRGAPGLPDRAWPLRSVRLRPEIHEADGLDPLGLDLIELADPLWLPLEVPRELREPSVVRDEQVYPRETERLPQGLHL